MELTVNYLGNFQFEAEARGHTVICDQPIEDHGDDEGMTPTELMLVSLAACSGHYAVYYLKTRDLPREGLRVKVDAVKAASPSRIGKFTITVEAPGLTDPHHIEGVRRSVAKCLVKNTMAMPPEFEVEIKSLDPVAGCPA